MSLLTTSGAETARMERILSSPVLGIAYVDGQLHVQEFEDDPQFREMLEEYFRQRIHQATLSEAEEDTKDYYFSLEHEGKCPQDFPIEVPTTPGSFDTKWKTIMVCNACRHLYPNAIGPTRWPYTEQRSLTYPLLDD